MITTAIANKPLTMLQSSFENHRRIFAHLKATEKYLEATLRTKSIKIVSLDVLNK